MYRSGDPSPTGNVTVTLDQFGGIDTTAFVCYSETQPNITLAVAVINDGERMSAPSLASSVTWMRRLALMTRTHVHRSCGKRAGVLFM